ncbi:MAG: hypothetical protein HYZ42_07790, partial [Bacteroidetes bacterium]|nr:hypothetical protein [Bacteroidota bacterium]
LYYSYAAINSRNKFENEYQKCKAAKAPECDAFLTSKYAYSDKAKITLNKMVDGKYIDPIVYIQLEQLQLSDGDTAGALSTIEKGLVITDNNKDLVNEELRIYQARNDMNGLIIKLTKSIELDPNNPNTNYILTRGNLYDRHKAEYIEKRKMADTCAKKSTPSCLKNLEVLDRAIDSCTALAEADYKKCTELNTNDTFAFYSLGVLYIQQCNPLIAKQNALNEKKPDYAQKLEGFKAQRKVLLEKAKPLLERSYELKQDDYDIAYALFQLYSNLDMKDKAMEFKKKKDELKR